MNAPPSYQEVLKMLSAKDELLTKTIEENKSKELVFKLRIHFAEEAMKTYQRAYHRVSTQESILEEKVRRLEGRE
jgi:ABC-type iron transport system FetAB ATPase subunit